MILPCIIALGLKAKLTIFTRSSEVIASREAVFPCLPRAGQGAPGRCPLSWSWCSLRLDPVHSPLLLSRGTGLAGTTGKRRVG
jgi:hypothetical protein